MEDPLVYHSSAHVFADEKVVNFSVIQVHHANSRNRDVAVFEPSCCQRLEWHQIGLIEQRTSGDIKTSRSPLVSEAGADLGRGAPCG